MKKIPYGYRYEAGHVVIDEVEAIVVRSIFDLYENGISLAEISKTVIGRFSNETLNKSKVNRILSDERYAGKDLFPIIIDISRFEKIGKRKTLNSTQLSESSKVLEIKTPFICSSCGGTMRRYHDSRRCCQERWKCNDCGFQIRYSDEDLVDEFKNVLKVATADYSAISDSRIVQTMEMSYKSTIISNSLLARRFEKETIKSDILRLVELKISNVSRTSYVEKMIKEAMARFVKNSDYVDTLNNVAKQIVINTDRTLEVSFKDGAVYGIGEDGLYRRIRVEKEKKTENKAAAEAEETRLMELYDEWSK